MRIIIALIITIQYILASNVSINPKTMFLNESKTTQLAISNNSPEPVAYEISIVNRSQNQDNTFSNSTEDENFLIIPSQVLLPPYSNQTVNITYLKNKIAKEESFAAEVRQIHLDLNNKDTKINELLETGSVAQVTVLKNFIKTFFISNSKFTSNVSIEKSFIKDDKLFVTFLNNGTRNAIFGVNAPLLTIIAKNTEGKLINLSRAGIIYAKSKVDFHFSLKGLKIDQGFPITIKKNN